MSSTSPQIMISSNRKRMTITINKTVYHYDFQRHGYDTPRFIGTSSTECFYLTEIETIFRDISCGIHSGIPWCCMMDYVGNSLSNDGENWGQFLDIDSPPPFDGYALCPKCVIQKIHTQTNKLKPLKKCTCGIDKLNKKDRESLFERLDKIST